MHVSKEGRVHVFQMHQHGLVRHKLRRVGNIVEPEDVLNAEVLPGQVGVLFDEMVDVLNYLVEDSCLVRLQGSERRAEPSEMGEG